MEQIELNVQPRTVVGKQVKALRRAGDVPAVLYSRHDEPMILQANNRELLRVLARAGGSRLVKLHIAGQKEAPVALVREVQREPIKGAVLHVDFFGVSMTEAIKVEVPIRYEGVSPAVTRNEGVLIHAMDSIEIECLPGDLIDTIAIDVSTLDKVGDVIRVSDLKVPDTIKLLVDLEATVARVSHLAGEEVEAPVAAEAVVAEPEVIKKGKAEEEEGEEAKE
ncbi:MAG TPA: 50S ribosomal protein L25 [Anaerolineae bacterium]|nr:50S ribosomal protein L25 [Anaerolineae bacterium]